MTPVRVQARRTFASLGNGNYRKYFLGQGVSQAGTWMQSVAVAVLVLHLTGSPTWLGTAVGLQFLPFLLLGPYGGLVVDRRDTRRVLIATQVAMGAVAAALAVLTITGAIQLWMVLALTAISGLANVFDAPARQAFVREMVAPDQVRNAVSLNSVVMNVARAVGPAIGGILIATTGIGTSFAVNAISYAAVLIAFARMDVAALHRVPSVVRERGQVRQGFAYVRRTPILLVPVIMLVIIGMLTYEFGVVLPAMAETTFGTGAQGLGLLTGAMGVGAVIGGLYSAGRTSTGLRPLVIAAGGFGVAVLATSVAPTQNWALAGMALVGAASVQFLATGNSTLQLHTVPSMRGRVMALWTMAFFGTTPIGGPLVGLVAEQVGPRWAMALGGAAALVAAALGFVAARYLRTRSGTASPKKLVSPLGDAAADAIPRSPEEDVPELAPSQATLATSPA